MDRINETINLLIRVEGIRLHAYPDSKGIITLGIGTTHYPNKEPVKIGDSCTIYQAKEWLRCHLNINVFPLLRVYNVPDTVYVALSSFIYNVGHLSGSIISAINKKDWHGLSECFKEYVDIHVNDKIEVCPGLVNRREIEIKYMMSGV